MTNALGAESSAYLKSAAHQPVYWQPWSDAAFAHAKRDNKPILLDIGAVWCHWCHVMDGESYENEAVASFLNEAFVCIKVDRDERPDVDIRYQRAVQALTGQGGWPLTAFLTPDGQVFFGGTYFPPENNAYDRPGFLTVLRHVARAYHADLAKVEASARAIHDHVVATLDESKRGVVDAATLGKSAEQMARLFDTRFGGFGTAPKFPHPGALQFLTARWYDERTPWMREVVEKTLTGMAHGGIHDQLGGGFHRYSVDERWIVPHFEKMSYDNSELLHAYLDGYAAFGTPLFRAVANGIVDWVTAVLSNGRDAFFTSQDADLAFGDDGDYWTWTLDEARAVLPEPELAVLARVFDIGELGEMHHKPEKNVLWWHEDPAPAERLLFQSAVRRLKAARDGRPRPYVDTTSYVNWGAMMAAAFLHAGAVLDRPECNTLALAALEKLWTDGWNETRGMSHTLGKTDPHGLLEDNVQSAAAFLDAYEATGTESWLERATTVMQYCLRAHWDQTDGGFFDLARRRRDAAYLATPAKTVQDAPTPSGNAVAALVLARLAVLTDDAEWRERFERQLGAFGGALAELSLYGATLARAADWLVNPASRIEVTGPTGPGPACDMHLIGLQTFHPRKIVIRKPGPEPSAVVCVGTTCSLPVKQPEALGELLREHKAVSHEIH